ncbi:MAG: hypothetical protein M1835_003051 [Candelina submexicana]|nr:MAG: hypothetical protein M1835_003051 [Candelina submexicana]
MSASAQGSSETTKAVVDDTKPSDAAKEQQKPAAALEEDDEFEDFPVEGRFCESHTWRHYMMWNKTADSNLSIEDWSQEDAEVPGGNTHLWEESWDDDDTSDDFSAQLKEELKKVDANKRG